MTSRIMVVPAHPRSRGEHLKDFFMAHGLYGSSPLARGTPRHIKCPCEHHRLIPARAGNTLSMFLEWRLFTAHPRSRGEHFHDASATRAGAGSSPLARGTLRKVSYALGPSRLIPARAGNTQVEGFADFSASAHPRSRGEHLPYRDPRKRTDGSSPLARGTLRDSNAETG